MTDKFTEIIKEAQSIMQNLFEVEYYGANDVEEEKNKIKRQKKDKNGDIVDVVSVEDELFPYEGNAKQQYNQKIISKINDMIEGRATLEDLIQLVRKKKTPVSESEFIAHKGNPVVKITDKNYKVAHGKGLPGPFNEKQIGQYIVYNKDTDASYLVTPDNWKKSKIKRDLEREGKVFEGAIELLEAMINEVSKVARFEAGKSSLPKREAEFSKVSDELDDLVKKHNYKYTGDINIASPKGWPYNNSKVTPEVEDKIEEFKKKADKRAHAKDIVDTEGEGHTSLFAKDTSKRSFSDHEKRIKKN